MKLRLLLKPWRRCKLCRARPVSANRERPAELTICDWRVPIEHGLQTQQSPPGIEVLISLMADGRKLTAEVRMAFRFPLQSLLKLRLAFEERERQRLAAVISRLNQLRSQYQAWQQQKHTAETKLTEQLKKGMIAVEFYFANASLEAEARRLKLVLAEITKVDQLRQAQQAAYLEAQKKRKILERLRDRQAEAYRLVEDRREQQRQDELFTIRHSRKQD